MQIINFIYLLLIITITAKPSQENKGITIQFSQDLLETFTPRPKPQQDNFDYLQHTYLPPTEQPNYINNISFCMFAQAVDNISKISAGALIIYRIYTLKNELQNIKAPYFWYIPLAWAQKFTRYGSCFLNIGKTAIQIALLRFFTKQLIAITCPKEFRKIYLSEFSNLKNSIITKNEKKSHIRAKILYFFSNNYKRLKTFIV